MATGPLFKADHNIEQKIKCAVSARLEQLIFLFERQKNIKSIKNQSNEV